MLFYVFTYANVRHLKVKFVPNENDAGMNNNLT
jgi:hypothetical protein